MSKAQHTPLPWYLHGTNTISAHAPGSAEKKTRAEVNGTNGGYYVGDTYGADDSANSAFIVRACNAHYDLIAALEEAREHIDGEIDVVDGSYGEPAPNKAMQLAQTIEEALRKAGAPYA